jgi:hypothetical protein
MRFTNKIQAIKAVREAGKVSTAQAVNHIQQVMSEAGEAKPNYLIAIGLKDSKDLVEDIMALGVERYKADTLKAAAGFGFTNEEPSETIAREHALQGVEDRLDGAITGLSNRIDAVVDRADWQGDHIDGALQRLRDLEDRAGTALSNIWSAINELQIWRDQHDPQLKGK